MFATTPGLISQASHVLLNQSISATLSLSMLLSSAHRHDQTVPGTVCSPCTVPCSLSDAESHAGAERLVPQTRLHIGTFETMNDCTIYLLCHAPLVMFVGSVRVTTV